MGNISVRVIDMDKGIVQVSNVRLGFKSLWGPNIVKGKDSERHTAQFLFGKDDEAAFHQVFDVAKHVYREATGGKGKVAFNDGKSRNASGSVRWDGERFGIFEEKTGAKWYCLRTTQPSKYDPVYIDNKGRPVRDFDYTQVEDKVIYAGCRVNVKLQYTTSSVKGEVVLWPNLVAIQFAGHDQAFGGMSEETLTEGFSEVASPVNEETGFGEVANSSSDLDIRNLM